MTESDNARLAIDSVANKPSTELPPELESRFIEQEHRIIRVVQNFYASKAWPPEDPRRNAARNALIWRVLTPGSAAIATSGLLAVTTLAVLVWQTNLIAEQNQYFKDQNLKLQQQIDQQADQDTNRRRTEIIAALYETQAGREGRLEARANGRTRAEAVSEFIQLERQRLKRLQQRLPSYQAELSLTQARLDGLNLDNIDVNGFSFIGTFLQNTSFAKGNLTGTDFRAAQLESTSFRSATLADANFEGANPLQTSFARADLRRANFTSSGVRGCEFLGADLRLAQFQGLRDWENQANFRFANIAGAKGLSPEARKFMLEQGAVEIEDDQSWNQFQQARFR